MANTVNYESIVDFSELAAIRAMLARHETGLTVTGVSSLKLLKQLTDSFTEHGYDLRKPDLVEASPSPEKQAMQSFHKMANGLFNNLSHALELPWEKYLSEMHEFTAPSRTELRVLRSSNIIPNEWSTLTLVVNLANPTTVHVLFGAALEVFSESTTPLSTSRNVDLATFGVKTTGDESSPGDWVVYYLRPNEDVFYTRTAGALMTPLSTGEHETRQRVRTAIV